MKIKKITYIKNIWSFKDFKWDDEIVSDFHDKWNIFYGINWSWKTTLSELIRSISLWEYTDDIKSKNERNLWKFKITHDWWEFNETVFWKNENIKVFDKRFVEENVFLTWWAKPIMLIAEKSWEIDLKIKQIDKSIEMFRNKIKKIENKINKKEIKLNQEKTEIWRIISEKINDKTFNKTKVEQCLNKPNFEKHNYSAEEIQKFKSILFEEKKEMLSSIPLIDKNKYGNIYENFSKILKKTIVPDELSFDENVESWIHEWLEIHKNKDKCEFCGNVIDKNRFNLLLKHFDEEYKKILIEIDSLIELINKNKLEVDLFDSWKLYKEFNQEYLGLKEIYKTEAESINNRLLSMTQFLENKRKSIWESVDPAMDNCDFNQLIKTIGDINNLVKNHNDRSLSFQTAQNEAKNKIIKNYCSTLYDENIYLNKKKNIYNLIKKKKNYKINKLINLKSSLYSQIKPEKKAEWEINDKIHAIMWNDHISLQYTENWYKIIRKDTWKAFKPSEWECTIIWFAYFLIKLKETDTDIVVFDDPMSSLDEDNLYRIFSIISVMKDEGKQIFISTHHYQFLRLFLDEESITRNSANYYRIDKEKWNSYIKNMEESLKNYKSEYHFIFKTLYNFWQDSESWNIRTDIDIEDCYNYANMSRKLLEIFTSIYSRNSNFKWKFISTFKGENFDNFDKELIYKFVNNYSHNNSIDSIKPQDMSIYINTLPNIIKQIMCMIEKKNSEHFSEMIQNR